MKTDVFTTADILLPHDISLEAWSVIACDQFSSEPEYWERVSKIVGDKPSTLNMIVPEAYLEKIDEETHIAKIRSAMECYADSGVFRKLKDSFIYVERTQPNGRVRKGIVGAVDLEEYDFTGKSAAIRASEGTVLDRLPPRIRIRRAAPLEMPHIITFIDDKNETVVEPLSKRVDEFSKVYDFTLMENGGSIKGWQVSGVDADSVKAAMRFLHESNEILMVMGDGNHSLAAAKVYWDELKLNLSKTERENHPARIALTEINNVYDPAISFKAIHRLLFDIDAAGFIKAFEDAALRGCDYNIRWVSSEGSGDIGIKADCIGDMLTMMQSFVDEYVKKSKSVIDYIHGGATAEKLAKGERCLGLILPAMDKSDIFETVALRGVFPRKSFSVGHAHDKRYYLECRRIVHG
jgi:uncharacterized protein (DUF1015 family)